MGHLVFILASLALLWGFVALMGYEARRGIRVFAGQRDRLDRNVERAEFILRHVDFGAFAREEMRRIAERVSHDAAHLSLQAVRAAERLLTRLVRHLRSRRADDVAPRENARAFVKTLSDFKGQLKASHPEPVDIQ